MRGNLDFCFTCLMFLWLWVFEPTVDLLFCLQQQKSKQKNAAPITAPRKKHGVPIITVLNKAVTELTRKRHSLKQPQQKALYLKQ